MFKTHLIKLQNFNELTESNIVHVKLNSPPLTQTFSSPFSLALGGPNTAKLLALTRFSAEGEGRRQCRRSTNRTWLAQNTKNLFCPTKLMITLPIHVFRSMSGKTELFME